MHIQKFFNYDRLRHIIIMHNVGYLSENFHIVYIFQKFFDSFFLFSIWQFLHDPLITYTTYTYILSCC